MILGDLCMDSNEKLDLLLLFATNILRNCVLLALWLYSYESYGISFHLQWQIDQQFIQSPFVTINTGLFVVCIAFRSQIPYGSSHRIDIDGLPESQQNEYEYYMVFFSGSLETMLKRF